MNDRVKFWQGYDRSSGKAATAGPTGIRGQVVYVYNPLFSEMRDTWTVRCKSMFLRLPPMHSRERFVRGLADRTNSLFLEE